MGGMDARPWQFSIRDALAATALSALAAWFAHYTAAGTEPLLRLAGFFMVPALIGAAVGVIAGSIRAGSGVASRNSANSGAIGNNRSLFPFSNAAGIRSIIKTWLVAASPTCSDISC
jgi:hypothetical protein